MFESTADAASTRHRRAVARRRFPEEDSRAEDGPDAPADDRFDGDGGAPPRVRLAQLAAEARGRGDPMEAPSPRHSLPPRGLARLVERWSAKDGRVTSPQRRHTALAAAVVGVLGAGIVTAMVLAGAPEPERAPPLPDVRPVSVSSDAQVSGAAASASAPPTSLVVSVVGTVAEPGLITVKPGARVADAIELAGGASSDSDLHTVNLARRVSDGEQIYVGVTPPPGASDLAAGIDGSTLSNGDGSKVDLNAADNAMLQTLPGVGEVTASRILEWREAHGRFTSVEQLREIDGIGEKRYARLREQVSVG